VKKATTPLSPDGRVRIVLVIGVGEPLTGAIPLTALQQLAHDVQSGLLVLIELGIRVLEQRFRISHADHRLLGVSRRAHRQKHRH
jgi:hypothetical protein